MRETRRKLERWANQEKVGGGDKKRNCGRVYCTFTFGNGEECQEVCSSEGHGKKKEKEIWKEG